MWLTLLSAFLFYLSFPNYFFIYGFWPCVWFFAVPLLWAMQYAPWPKRIVYGTLFGCVAYGLLVHWLFPLSIVGFLALALALGIQGPIFGVGYWLFSRRSIQIIYIPFLWCLSEAVRNWLMGGFTFHMSNTLAFFPALLKIYGLIGSGGVSFLIILANTFFYMAIEDKPKRVIYLLAVAGIILGMWAVGEMTYARAPHLDQTKSMRIGIIQPNIGPKQKLDLNLFEANIEKHLDLTSQCVTAGHPDVIVWPETAYPDDLLENPTWRRRVTSAASALRTDIIMGVAPIINGKEYNSVLLINAEGQPAGLYHKRMLVPFSEFAPLAGWGIPWGKFHFSPGHQAGIFALPRVKAHCGLMVCSESGYAGLVHNLKGAGVDFIVELSNDAWLVLPQAHLLHAQLAIIRAAENRIWVVRAANTGLSFAVGPDGILHLSPNLKLGQEGFGIFDIIISSGKS